MFQELVLQVSALHRSYRTLFFCLLLCSSETTVRILLPVFSMCLISSTCVASEFKDLFEIVPPRGNAAMAIDVARALASPLAKKEGWDGKLTDGGAGRPLNLPPEADKVLSVSQVDIVRDFSNLWTVTLFGLTDTIPLRLVARAEGGYVDQVGDTDAVWIPSDAYVMQADDHTLVMQSPANRQEVARWARSRNSSTDRGISDFLRRALVTVEKEPQIVMAVDATDSVQVHRVKQQLEQSGFAEEHSVSSVELTALLTGLKGVILEITLTDKVTGLARIEFSEPVSMNSATAKALVLNALNVKQMSLPGIESWKCSVASNSIVLTGNLPMESLRRVVSLLEPPSTKFSSLKDANVEESTGDDISKNSLAYFQSTQALLKDLRKESGSSGNDAHWIDRYAAKIDRLPILHVDEDLLDYGQKLSETLRYMSGSRKMSRIQGGSAARGEALSGGNAYDSGYGYGYGYGNYSYGARKARQASAGNARINATAAGSSVKIQGWNAIDNATTEIRREMTKRYEVEF